MEVKMMEGNHGVTVTEALKAIGMIIYDCDVILLNNLESKVLVTLDCSYNLIY